MGKIGILQVLKYGYGYENAISWEVANRSFSPFCSPQGKARLIFMTTLASKTGGYLLEMTPLKITANTDCLLCFGGNAATLYELIPHVICVGYLGSTVLFSTLPIRYWGLKVE